MAEEKKLSFPEQIISDFGSIEKGIEWFQQNIQKEPIDYRLNLQVLLNLVGREEEAYEVSNQLMLIASEDPRILFNRGWHLIHRGQFHEGFSLLENGRQFGGYGHPQPVSPMSILHRDMVLPNHAKILLHTEGGFGDEIINFRFVENIRKIFGCQTIVACQRQLVPLFAKHPDVAAAIDKTHIMGVYHDVWLPAMSAPAMLCDSMDDVSSKPYLFVDEIPQKTMWQEMVEKNRKPSRSLKIGLRWAGSPQFEHQQYRKFPADVVLNLAKTKDCQFYSFQRDNDLVDLPEEVADLGPFLNDWADTACALSEMDLVITSCTSIAHASGALGVPTWVITPVLPYYIWAQPGNQSAWYDSVTLFRQSTFGKWDDIASQLQQELNKFHKNFSGSKKKAS